MSTPEEKSIPLYATDLDETLRGKANKRLLQKAYKEGYISLPRLVNVLGFLFAEKAHLISFEKFVQKVQEKYGFVLKGQERDYAFDLYKKIANDPELEYDGAVDFIQNIISAGVHVAITTGSDTEFARIFFDEHDCDTANMTILGSEYERHEETGLYTGKMSASHVTYEERRQALEGKIQKRFQGKPIKIIGWGGNRYADRSGFQLADQSGLRIVSQDDKKLFQHLLDQGFNIHTSMDTFLEDDPSKRVYHVGIDNIGNGVSYAPFTPEVIQKILGDQLP
ncbi:haloacid dehalogenase-like hydrolase [Candidatus Peregrinibacteria bacterium]|nr:haloacid dehalogenase-like hydrolase [Candidatus Peregrinibacteria bacterium]